MSPQGREGKAHGDSSLETYEQDQQGHHRCFSQQVLQGKLPLLGPSCRCSIQNFLSPSHNILWPKDFCKGMWLGSLPINPREMATPDQKNRDLSFVSQIFYLLDSFSFFFLFFSTKSHPYDMLVKWKRKNFVNLIDMIMVVCQKRQKFGAEVSSLIFLFYSHNWKKINMISWKGNVF